VGLGAVEQRRSDEAQKEHMRPTIFVYWAEVELASTLLQAAYSYSYGYAEGCKRGDERRSHYKL
jgi:hypothetical protein